MGMKDGPLFQISTPVFEGVLEFCRTGELNFSELVSPEEVFRVAHLLEIEFLKDFCEAGLCRQLSVDSVPQMLKLARRFKATKLQKEAEKIFKVHFDELKTKMYDVWFEETDATSVSVPASDVGAPISVPKSDADAPISPPDRDAGAPISVPDSDVGAPRQD
ncbi:unnamed protein product [Calypogeia fissa]